jgi:uncharacterized protein YbaR (Trm112 family)
VRKAVCCPNCEHLLFYALADGGKIEIYCRHCRRVWVYPDMTPAPDKAPPRPKRKATL